MSTKVGALALHPLIEIHSDDAQDSYRVRTVGSLRAHTVDRGTVEILRSIAGGAVPKLDSRGSAVLDWLLQHGYVMTADGDEYQSKAEITQNWRDANWEFAARYHFETYGYPFERYTRGQSSVDTARMNGYVEDQPDLDRGKSYFAVTQHRRALPPAHSVTLQSITSFLHETGPARDAQSDVFDALSLIGLPVRRDPMPWAHSRKVLRKTSPSGGSRHPSEIYVVNRRMPQIEAGVHHINGDEEVMDLLPDSSSSVELLLDACSADHTVDAALVFTSFFARNRFRYREPRTFRTVHMDVGHLMTTAEYVLEAIGHRANGTVHIDAERISEALALDPLVEHPIAALLVGGTAATRTIDSEDA